MTNEKTMNTSNCKQIFFKYRLALCVRASV
jgi:hypothetical protein